jgi:hypothetical protein
MDHLVTCDRKPCTLKKTGRIFLSSYQLSCSNLQRTVESKHLLTCLTGPGAMRANIATTALRD